MTSQTYHSFTFTVHHCHLNNKHIQEEYHKLRLHLKQSVQLEAQRRLILSRVFAQYKMSHYNVILRQSIDTQPICFLMQENKIIVSSYI